GLGVLHDGLDHQLTVGEVLEGGGEGDAAENLIALGLLQLAAGNGLVQGLFDAGLAGVKELLLRLPDQHVAAGLRANLDDAGTHLAGADDANSGDLVSHVLARFHSFVVRGEALALDVAHPTTGRPQTVLQLTLANASIFGQPPLGPPKTGAFKPLLTCYLTGK